MVAQSRVNQHSCVRLGSLVFDWKSNDLTPYFWTEILSFDSLVFDWKSNDLTPYFWIEILSFDSLVFD